MNLLTSKCMQQGNREMQDRADIFHVGGRIVLAVADGAGGISGGAEAAELFSTIVGRAAASLSNVEDCTRLLNSIDRELANASECGETTGVVVVIDASTIFGASVGDSAAKLFGVDEMDDLTRGQSRKPFLGTGSAYPQGFTRKLRLGTIVVATDGLWKYTSIELIEQCVRHANTESLAMQLSALVRLPSGVYPDDVAIMASCVALACE